MTDSHVYQFPPELISAICAAVYHAGVPPSEQSLDPLIIDDGTTPSSLPSAYPASYISEPIVRKSLSSFCLVNRAWYNAAKPWLWRKIEVQYPASWLALIDEVSGGEHELSEVDVDQSIKMATQVALSVASPSIVVNEAATRKFHESIIASLSGPDGSIPPELLSPPASREPSPRRLRQKSQSPARWKIIRSISDAVQRVMHQNEPDIYVPVPEDSLPGRYVHHLDFNHFRTIGMRRSLDEAVNSRFVTSERLQIALKELPNLTAFGATEYMDGALTFEVLKELFLRGTPSRGRGRPSRAQNSSDADSLSLEEEERERLRECQELVALDLTGCVSAVFVNALTEFVNVYIPHEDPEPGKEDQAMLYYSDHSAASFPGLKRLGLRGVKSVSPNVLNMFILSFPSLTHVDLSGTRITPDLLLALGSSRTIRLQSLGLSRCVALTGDAISDFLVDSPVTRNLTEITLYGDATYPSPLNEENLRRIIKTAPSFTSGDLKYLDISSSPVTADLLGDFCYQSQLRSLGLSYIPTLTLSAIKDFLIKTAPNVEVISIISTSPELASIVPVRQISLAFHSQFVQHLCVSPCSFDEQQEEPPTRLRVIELSVTTLNRLGAGFGSWKVIRSKGGRAWYVDTASGWVAECGTKSGLRRDLNANHPWRMELEKLADANGNVSSGIGWHARKLEILHGHGLLGREDGLYGAVSFAYQG